MIGLLPVSKRMPVLPKQRVMLSIEEQRQAVIQFKNKVTDAVMNYKKGLTKLTILNTSFAKTQQATTGEIAKYLNQALQTYAHLLSQQEIQAINELLSQIGGKKRLGLRAVKKQEGGQQVISEVLKVTKRLRAHHKKSPPSLTDIEKQLNLPHQTWLSKKNVCLGENELKALEHKEQGIFARIGNYQGIEDAWEKLKKQYPGAENPGEP